MNGGNWPHNCRFALDGLQFTVGMIKHVPICVLTVFLCVRIYYFNFILGAMSWRGGSFVGNISDIPGRRLHA